MIDSSKKTLGRLVAYMDDQTMRKLWPDEKFEVAKRITIGREQRRRRNRAARRARARNR